MAVKKGAAATKAAGKNEGWKAFGWIMGVTAAIIAGILVFSDTDNDTMVPAPTATERTDTVAILTRASQAQNICYGWQLEGGYRSDAVSVGSNLGDNVPVDEDPTRCPRWILVTADVNYTSESSESNDWVYVNVRSSSDLSTIGFTAGLEQLGVDDDAFLDEPGWAITRAAVFLPLLAAEHGLAEPVPVVTADPDPTASVPPLPAAGNDFLRDRWAYLLGVAGLLLVTVLFVTIGLVQRRRRSAELVAAERRAALIAERRASRAGGSTFSQSKRKK
ncbi:hypothetical protein GCM10027290_40290 [Micromonospora sonneratiae]|uniref:SURF1-like protein n=1 Tax=Micromonospora sonneratiae TaxID=1184706 RepID=A0ABW3YC77_9ACTN